MKFRKYCQLILNKSLNLNMKLKIRISFLILVLSVTVFVLMCCVYFKCGFNISSHLGYLPLDGDTMRQVDEVAAMKKELWSDELRFMQRKKRSKVKTEPVVYGDSNQAAEIIAEDENDDFLNDVSLPTKRQSYIPASNSLVRSKLAKDCLATERRRFWKDNRQHFSDLVKLSREMQASLLFNSATPQPRNTLKQLFSVEAGNNLTTMQSWQNNISTQDLYDVNDPAIDTVLERLATMRIKRVVELSRGTQLKLIVTFEDESQALLKPMRYDRDKESNPNHFYFNDFERHNSEIASFHLDRILGFRCCPPVIGRKVNIKAELFDNAAEKEFKKTFFISPADNICFHGHCKQYCDTSHAICGQPATVEVSLAAMLVPERKKLPHPWKRTYSKKHPIAEWQKNDSYCRGVKQQVPNKRLADFMDMVILDFLIGNLDRHSFETFTIFGNNSFILHLDQGRGFGRASYDELSILTPLKQCCYMHPKTFYKLIELQHGDLKLSARMRCSLYKDPVNPVLPEAHLEALDRRLQIILQAIRDCIQKNGKDNVFHR